jgi:hypothetical protein
MLAKSPKQDATRRRATSPQIATSATGAVVARVVVATVDLE